MLVSSRRFLSSRRNFERFALLASALEAYYKQNDHFLVPSSFQVPHIESLNPSDLSWPEQTHGLNLGREIRHFVVISSIKNPSELQKIRDQLDAIGFPSIRDWKRFQWEQMSLAALIKYKEIEGDLLVPRKFVVPKEDEQWPRPTWGLKLGSHVNYIRQKRDRLIKYQIQNLDDIGFVWVVAHYNWDMVFMPALRRYREIYGHCDIPQNFVVSEDVKGGLEKWPKELRGYRLGATVNRIRAISAYAEYVERDKIELEELGFYLNSHDHKWTETILPALKTYHCLYGACNIDTLFSVPKEKPWPLSAWGLRLGFIAQNIRNRGDFFLQVAQDYDKLKEIGFVWNTAASKWETVVMPALKTYVLEYGNTRIPAHFVVPCKDPWPKESHGLKLGELATIAARQEQFTDFIAIDRMQLEALGFFWTPLGP
ncbi:unnamed protein product [Peronospora farinosa]|uniref:Helicase-associated domain-containing protein n=1 Tax=Peronospora farinosa TaxID=134698 RepID=A0AAV0T5C6_9STRA|nr:unnamed protein product [Peronospora farinosa]